MEIENKIFTSFLIEINETKNWSQLILQVQIQPGFLGFKGWVISEDGEKKSLRTKPTDELKGYIKNLHSQIATSAESKWNKLEFILLSNMNFKRMLIWDSDWQRTIDLENRKFKQKNPDYKVPKWKWEDNELLS